MKKIAEKILSHESLQVRPPVLIDIGASGGLPVHWKLLAPHSICVAFDADTRDFELTESASGGWKKLYSFNRLVAAQGAEAVDFYLARSPHCSSSLPPDTAALEPWAFSPLFEVERRVQLPAIDLASALAQLNLDYIDWYKSDSQGTDLRIFRSLAEAMTDGILVAEFEPGIIDAYQGEDKLPQLMAYMDTKPFWVSDMVIKGSQRISRDALAALGFLQRRHIASFLKTSPGWCEITYLNRTESAQPRELLLSWLFASIKQQHGFAWHVAAKGLTTVDASLFAEMQDFSQRRLSSSYLSLGKKAVAKLRKGF